MTCTTGGAAAVATWGAHAGAQYTKQTQKGRRGNKSIKNYNHPDIELALTPRYRALIEKAFIAHAKLKQVSLYNENVPLPSTLKLFARNYKV